MIPAMLLFLGGLTHFWKFGQPAKVVFDETYAGTFISHYWSGTYFFDQHPPLAKLILATFGYVTGLSGIPTDWSQVGNQIDPLLTSLRIIPSIAGMLLPIVIYFICRKLEISKLVSTIIGVLLCFEGSLIVQSRFLMHDSIVILLGFLAMLFYLMHASRKNNWFVAGGAIFIALAVSIKWFGILFLILILIMDLFERRSVRKTARTALPYVAAIIVIYISVFAVHFSVLKNPQGDIFQKALQVPQYEYLATKPSGNFLSQFAEVNYGMYVTQRDLRTDHTYASAWYTWPLMARPVFYGRGDEITSRIYLFGNPVLYWLGTLSIFFLIGLACWRIYKKKKSSRGHIWVLAGYLVTFLPYALVTRQLYLYHYQTALVFSIMAIGICLESIRNRRFRRITAGTITILALASFIFFSPLTYGTPLDHWGIRDRVWFSSWR